MSTRGVLVFIISVACIRPVLSQSAAGADRGVARAIATLEARFDSALAARDTAALGRLLAPGFTWIPVGHVHIMPRDDFLASTQAVHGPALSRQQNVRTIFEPSLAVFDEHTVVSTARVHRRRRDGTAESWSLQRFVDVKGADGTWRVASVQATSIYDGPAIDTVLYARYAGTYEMEPEYRSSSRGPLQIVWEGGALVATLPNGTTDYLFLQSPTDQALATTLDWRLHFTLGSDGRPVGAWLERAGRLAWRARRASSD